jgi:hypothetical protein
VIAQKLTVVQTVRASPLSDCVKPFTCHQSYCIRWPFAVLWRTYGSLTVGLSGESSAEAQDIQDIEGQRVDLAVLGSVRPLSINDRPHSKTVRGLPWRDRLEGTARLASHGALSESMEALDGPTIARMSEYPRTPHCKPCRTSPRYRDQTRTNGLLEKLVGRLDAGQFFMAGVSFSSQI